VALLASRKLVAVLAGVASAFACGAALAQPAHQRGWYVGVSLGSSTASFDREFRDSLDDAIFLTSAITLDEKSGYGKLYAGYRLLPWFALEGGFTNLGSFTGTNQVTTSTGPGTVVAEVESRGIHIDGVFLLATQTNFTPFGKVGIVLAGTRIEYSASGSVGIVGDPVHEQGDGFFKLGLGIDYTFNRNISGRVELEHMSAGRKNRRSPEEDFNVFEHVNAFSLGVSYRF
jgi:OmpA-OmpF porin, OOP family